MTALWVALVSIADPQPCEPVPNLRGAWRCPGQNVCRQGQCVPDPADQPPPAVEIASPPRGQSKGQWLRENGRWTLDLGAFVGRDTPGVIEQSSAGASASLGLALRLRSWIGVELPVGLSEREFSSRTATPVPYEQYDDRFSLEQIWIGAIGGLDREVGRTRIKLAVGPELMFSNISTAATLTLPIGMGPPPTRVYGDRTVVGLALQWLAAIELPVTRYLNVGGAYRGHYARANFSSVLAGDADVGGHMFALRLSWRL